MSKLVFSPHASTNNSPRILIGLEAYSEKDYSSHVSPYQGRSWPAPVLRFMVYETDYPSSTRPYAGINLSYASTVSVDSVAGESSHGVSQSSAAIVNSTGVNATTARNDERKVLIERLRERTTSRSSSMSIPTPSLTSAYDDSTTIRLSPAISSDTLAREPRPLPPRPAEHNSSSRGSTARPSLFDLLSESSIPDGHLRSIIHDNDRSTKSRSRTITPERAIAPVMPTEHDSGTEICSPPLFIVRTPTTPSWCPSPTPIIVPPPPILYPCSVNACTMPSPTVSIDHVNPTPIYEINDSYVPNEPQQIDPMPQFNGSSAPQFTAPQLGNALPPAAQVYKQSSSKPVVVHCCSASRCKTEVKALVDKFMSDFQGIMKDTFGEDSQSPFERTFESPGPSQVTSFGSQARHPWGAAAISQWKIQEDVMKSPDLESVTPHRFRYPSLPRRPQMDDSPTMGPFYDVHSDYTSVRRDSSLIRPNPGSNPFTNIAFGGVSLNSPPLSPPKSSALPRSKEEPVIPQPRSNGFCWGRVDEDMWYARPSYTDNSNVGCEASKRSSAVMCCYICGKNDYTGCFKCQECCGVCFLDIDCCILTELVCVIRLGQTWSAASYAPAQSGYFQHTTS